MPIPVCQTCSVRYDVPNETSESQPGETCRFCGGQVESPATEVAGLPKLAAQQTAPDSPFLESKRTVQALPLAELFIPGEMVMTGGPLPFEPHTVKVATPLPRDPLEPPSLQSAATPSPNPSEELSDVFEEPSSGELLPDPLSALPGSDTLPQAIPYPEAQLENLKALDASGQRLTPTSPLGPFPVEPSSPDSKALSMPRSSPPTIRDSIDEGWEAESAQVRSSSKEEDGGSSVADSSSSQVGAKGPSPLAAEPDSAAPTEPQRAPVPAPATASPWAVPGSFRSDSPASFGRAMAVAGPRASYRRYAPLAAGLAAVLVSFYAGVQVGRSSSSSASHEPVTTAAHAARAAVDPPPPKESPEARIAAPHEPEGPGGPAPSAPSAEPPAPAEAVTDPVRPFSAKAAYGSVAKAAVAAKACRKPGDPGGTVQASVTFAPDGNVASVAVTGAGITGTTMGNCIAEELKTARVQPFSGKAATVRRLMKFK